jgi:hypothetical protein
MIFVEDDPLFEKVRIPPSIRRTHRTASSATVNSPALNRAGLIEGFCVSVNDMGMDEVREI